MAKVKGLSLGTFLKQFSTEKACQEHLADQLWKEGYVCPNVAADIGIGWEMDGISAPNAAIRSQ